ncbi:MAG TPA: hypothetical protein VKP65_10035 [Rhodothermales bacterium]|nr:hypothetical protein [Rhodothermales bacterium]
MPLVNLTKEPIRLHDTAGAFVEIPPDPRHLGVVAVGDHRSVTDGNGHAFSLNVRTIKEIKGMPEPEADTVYIVPVEVAMALQAVREDVVFPADEAHVRNTEGQLQRITHLRRIVSRLT